MSCGVMKNSTTAFSKDSASQRGQNLCGGTQVPRSSAVGCNHWYNNPSASSLNITRASWSRDVIHALSFNISEGDL